MFGKVVVTGGAGFIGSHLVDRLVRLSSEVVVIDDFSTGNMRNLEYALKSSNLKLIKSNICDDGQTKTALKDSEVLFHEAAFVNVIQSFINPQLTNRTNIEGTRNLIKSAINSRTIQKIILASSSAVYGDTNILPTPEDSPTIPISPYGVSKLKAEEICLEASRNTGLSVTVFRYFNVYGERSSTGPYSGVISKFAERLLSKKSLQIFGDGKQTRDFINVDDIITANVLAGGDRLSIRRVFNVGTGSRITIRDLAVLELKLILNDDPGVVIEFLEAKKGDIQHSFGDVSRIRDELGFVSTIDLETGLARYLTWLSSQTGK